MRTRADHDSRFRDDEDLARAAQAGNHAAFEKLVERYWTLICSLACALTASVVDSEELAQEVFIVAWRQLPKCEPDRFRAWIFAITRNLSRNFRKGERIRRHAAARPPLMEPSASGPTPLDRLLSDEENLLVRRAIGAMPEVYRLALVLFYREQQSVRRVAEALRISEATVKMRLSRGRRMLQERITELESVLTRTRPPSKLIAAVMAVIAVTGPAPAMAAPARDPPSRSVGRAFAILGSALVLVVPLVAGGAHLLGRATPPPASGPSLETSRVERSRALGSALRAGAASASGAAGIQPAGEARGTMFSFDFEDGVAPPIFTEGYLVPGPPRGANRYCLIGTLRASWFRGQEVMMGDAMSEASTVFHHSPMTVISFDYWRPEDADSVKVEIYDNEKRRNYYLAPDLVRERLPVATWMHVEARLIDFLPVLNGAGAMEAGDALRMVSIFGGNGAGGKPFYVDNIAIINYPTDKLPPKSTFNAAARR